LKMLLLQHLVSKDMHDQKACPPGRARKSVIPKRFSKIFLVMSILMNILRRK
jgi:hypothetical protein